MACFTNKCRWNQTLAEVTVYADLPAGTVAKAVTWTITTGRVRVTVAGEVLIEGELGGSVRSSECLWG